MLSEDIRSKWLAKCDDKYNAQTPVPNWTVLLWRLRRFKGLLSDRKTNSSGKSVNWMENEIHPCFKSITTHSCRFQSWKARPETCCLCVQVVSFRVSTTTSTKQFLHATYQGSGMQQCLKMMMTVAKLPTVFRTRLLSFWICQLDAMKLRIRMSCSCIRAVQLHQVITHQKTGDKHKNVGDMMPPRWLHTLDINRIIVLMSLLPQTSFAQVHLTTTTIAPQGPVHVSATEAMWIMLSASLHRLILGIVLLINQPRSVHCLRKRSSIDFVMTWLLCQHAVLTNIFSCVWRNVTVAFLLSQLLFSSLLWFSFYSTPQSHCKCCTSYVNSVRLSVTRKYCVKTTARSTVQFARSDSNMCLVV